MYCECLSLEQKDVLLEEDILFQMENDGFKIFSNNLCIQKFEN